MSLFKKVTKKAGKILGTASHFAKPLAGVLGMVGVPGASAIAALLPDASARVKNAAAPLMLAAAQTKPVSFAQAVEVAANAAQQLRAAGATETQANEFAQTVQTLSVQPPSVALSAIGVSPAEANNFTKEEGKAVLKGAIEGIKIGALDAYLEKTQAGREQKAQAVDVAGTRMMPYILGAAVLYLIFKK
jgi:hypothetical protein